MHFNILIYILCFRFVVCDSFFLYEWKEKKDPLCKICPTYCHPKNSRRYDEDASSLTYIDDDYSQEQFDEIGHKPLVYNDWGHGPPSLYDDSGPKPYSFEDSGHKHFVIEEDRKYPTLPIINPLDHKSPHEWKHKHPRGFEVEYNLKYIFKPQHYKPTTMPTTKPAPTTKPPPPPTTTAEPTWICMYCMVKCNYPPRY